MVTQRKLMTKGRTENNGITLTTGYITQKQKFCVVFDCSAKYKGTKRLNDHLLSGPDLINNLDGVIRFRQHCIAPMCDIEKMFHVCEADKEYLRFLWWKDGNLNAEPREYRMKVHLFGAFITWMCKLRTKTSRQGK